MYQKVKVKKDQKIVQRKAYTRNFQKERDARVKRKMAQREKFLLKFKETINEK